MQAPPQPASLLKRAAAHPRHNPTTANISIGEYYWGYASSVVATKIPGWGEFVLAKLTLPFDQPDVAYFHPLMTETERRLGFRPQYGAFDAAFDAFYVYEHFHRDDQPLDSPASPLFRSPKGVENAASSMPKACLCVKQGWPCPLSSPLPHYSFEHERDRYACPLAFPEPTGESCLIQHKNWPKGCVTTLATSVGARIRHQIDRESEVYKDVYKQRSATELGIERPKLRKGQAIANQNPLIYVLINLRALHRVRRKKTERDPTDQPTR